MNATAVNNSAVAPPSIPMSESVSGGEGPSSSPTAASPGAASSSGGIAILRRVTPVPPPTTTARVAPSPPHAVTSPVTATMGAAPEVRQLPPLDASRAPDTAQR